MVNKIRTLDFLPEVFRTPTNQQFLSASLDVLTSQPDLRRVEGFIGQKYGYGIAPTDKYVTEPSKQRSDYQLDPSVVFLKPDTQTAQDFINYTGILQALQNQGAITDKNDRLFESQFYSWDSFADLDKLVNYSQYYWIPNGPDPITITTNTVYKTQDYVVRDSDNGYEFAGINDTNPPITLLRGGTYTFVVNGTTPFWIQGVPGVTGRDPLQPNIDTRAILGVTNNGATTGVVTFTVPLKNAQDQYDLPGNLSVDLVTTLSYSQLNGVDVSTVSSIDGITNYNGRTVLFYNNSDAGSQTAIYTVNVVGTTITLINPQPIPNNQKITVQYGTQYIGRTFYRSTAGVITLIPYISASLDTLYYQGGGERLSVGTIHLVDNNESVTIDVNSIIGQANYTVPSYLIPAGLKLINGLKIRFEGNVTPASYAVGSYYVEGVGSSIKLLPVNEYLAVEYGSAGLYLPWDTVAWDQIVWDQLLYVPLNPDYLTISRNSRDRNGWSRSNRWFNQQVLDVTAQYNGTVTVVPGNEPVRAVRPIIEFGGDLRLFDSGTQFIGYTDLFSTANTNALTDVVGQPIGTVSVAGQTLADGQRVIFSADVVPAVRDTMYVVETVPAADGSGQIISLRTLISNIPDSGQTVVLSGNNSRTTWAYNATTNTWNLSQQKRTVNQAPLYDIYDGNGISLADVDYYPSTTFTGTKLFSYTPGTGSNDPVLGFPIAYSGVTNIGDIQFTVNMNSDVFTYVRDTVVQTRNINIGFVHYTPVQDVVEERTGWVTAAAPSVQYQVFEFAVSDATQSHFICDIPVVGDGTTPWEIVQVYYNDTLLNDDQFSYANISDGRTRVTLAVPATKDDKVTVLLLSDSVSANAYYTVPDNLQNNPFNTNITTVDVGDLRNQYRTIFGNVPGVSGQIFGVNNIYNLGDVTRYGTAIIQNSASLVLPGVFLRKAQLNLFEALQYNGDEYIDYKQLLLDTVNKNDFSVYQTAAEMLDTVVYQISTTKNSTDSFFWTDMLFSGSPLRVNKYTVNAAVDTVVYPLGRVYDWDNANYWGLGIYVTRNVAVPGGSRSVTTQLIRTVDYVTDELSPSVTVTYDFQPGDVVTVKEYNQTWGSYCPATPTSLGLYQRTVPAVYTDNTYSPVTTFIVGHDGSYNKLYGTYDAATGIFSDFRDAVLYEFEQRVFNNIKATYSIPLTYADVFPGEWRNTDYTRSELLQEYSTQFLRWVGKNRVDYKSQVYNAINPFTFNYNQSTNRLDGNVLQQGYWRGIYSWLYDSMDPANQPWQLLGYTDQPRWWTDRYGAAPYTSGNTLLWGDLAAGYNWNGGQPFIDSQRVRPQLLQALPVDGAGKLVAPQTSIVGNYNSLTYRRDWVVGDEGPAETSYLRSSTWPFDLMRLLALTKPAKFFNLFADRDRYRYDPQFDQYLYDSRYHIDPRILTIYGNGTITNSYINWVVDYINQRGVDGTDLVTTTLRNLDVRLTYNLAGFSAKNYLQFLIEKSTPNTQNSSLLIPDDSYAVLLYDNVPQERITYSSIIVQRTTEGYTVWGNSIERPYFTAVVPRPGVLDNITVGNVTVRVSNDYYPDRTAQVPYGTLFYSVQGVCEFIKNYGRYLTQQGIQYRFQEFGTVYNWDQMIQEFMGWAQQSWEVGSTVSMNPSATLLSVNREDLVVQPLTLQQQNFILNQNLLPLQSQAISVIRDGTEFNTTVLTPGDAMAYTNLNLNSFEHAVVFDNYTVFNDTIYNLTTGLRQSRLLLRGYKSATWNGYVDASGFILNQDNIAEWSPNRKYAKGSIVIHKAKYWAANVLIEPAAEFRREQWTETDFDSVRSGLLPNPSTRAYESLYYYDSYRANLENDADLLGFSLIGYRPRQYLQDADLSDITQVNVYKNIVREKGTNSILNAFRNAELAQGRIDYKVKENWAIKTGTFGSVLASNYVEALLNQAQLTGNPAIVGFTDNGAVPDAQQSISLNQLIGWERPPQSANFLPPYTQTYLQQRGLPSAGYANLDDAEIKAYSYDALNDDPLNWERLYRSSDVWIANYRGSWGMFQPVSVGTQLTTVTNNFNGTLIFTFADPHDLISNQPIAVVQFNNEVNGYYVVKTVNSNNSITVDGTLGVATQQFTGMGIVFKLVSRRFLQASDITSNILPNSEFYTKLAWVDRDNSNEWAVWGNGPVYKENELLRFSTANIGAAVAYSQEWGYLSLDNSTGTLYRTTLDGVTRTYIGGRGQFPSIRIAGNIAICSSPTTNRVYVYTLGADNNVSIATLNIANTGAVAISGDTQWLYVANATSQTVAIYNYNNTSGSYQFVATYSDPSVPAGSAWGASVSTNLDGSKIIVGASREDFADTVDSGAAYMYSRALQRYDADGVTTTYTVASTIPGTSPIADVYINGVRVDNANVSANAITFSQPPALGSVISVAYGAITQLQKTVSSRPHIGGLYGRASATNLWGAEVVVGVPFELTPVSGATPTEGAVYRWTNTGQRYGVVTGTVETTVTGNLFIDGYLITLNNADADAVAAAINAATPANVTASASGKQITIGVIQGTQSTPGNQLDIVAQLSVLAALGIVLYTNTQIVLNPTLDDTGEFGFTIALSNTDELIVGAPSATSRRETTFDYSDDNVVNDTFFDHGGTIFVDTFSETGAVYEYNLLPAADSSIINPDKFVFGQYINTTLTGASTTPRWGTALAVNDGAIIVGAPNWYVTGAGLISGFTAIDKPSSWYIDKQPIPAVNINSISNISLYNAVNNQTLGELDYIDPLQGKLLGVVETNIDFISQNDPAGYQQGVEWTIDKVGTTWLDTTNLRMLNYNQPDVVYNSANWGRAFPGSTADIFTWVESAYEPLNYVGSGYPVVFDRYTFATVLDRNTNTLVTRYYYWVKNYDMIPPGKTLAPTVVSGYLLNPIASGIAFLAPLTTNIVALYNSGTEIQSNTTALHLNYGTETASDAGGTAHTSWHLVQEDQATSFLPGFPDFPGQQPSGLYQKYLDSFAGQDRDGQFLPDRRLPPFNRYGVSFRPRQSMFRDKNIALQNYIQYANEILKLYPITETRSLNYLFNRGPENIVDGIDYGRTWDTPEFWEFIDWWAPGYSSSTKVILEVATYTDLLRLTPDQIITSNVGLIITLEDGLVVRIAANQNGTSETWVYNAATGWARIGVTLGTIRLKDNIWNDSDGWSSTTYDLRIWDKTNYQEVYWIIRWLNEIAYTGDLLADRNRSLILMFNYIQSEALSDQNYLPWLNKTSLIDVSHKVRDLLQYKKYQRDNQEFLSGYLNEVKPYHVYIKDFVYTYEGIDTYPGNVTDFDLPAQYNSTTGQFETPQLVYQPTFEPDQYTPDNPIWRTQQYDQWFENYGLTISSTELGNYAVTTLSATVNTDDFTIPVVNAYGLPYTGTAYIGEEQISYDSIDVINNTLLGVNRGINGIIESHITGTEVRTQLPAVLVLDSGRGYTEPPRITAYIDTDVYPQPRTTASMTSQLASGQVIAVNLTDGGSGYAVTPQIRFESSITAAFESYNVNTVFNIINMVDHPYVTGDSIVFKLDGTKPAPSGLRDWQYYYVYVIDANNIALYNNYADAITASTRRSPDQLRVQLITTGSGTLGITARAICFTTSQPVREFNIALKFNRVTYNTAVTPWTPGNFYAGVFVDPSRQSGSSLLASETAPASGAGAVMRIRSSRGWGYVWDKPFWDDIYTSDTPMAGDVVTLNIEYYTPLQPGQLQGKLITVYNSNWQQPTQYWAKVISANVIELYWDKRFIRPVKNGEFNYEYNDPILLPEPFVNDQSLVTYQGKLWQCVESNNDTTFDYSKWVQILADNPILSAADRTQAFYRPSDTMPGVDLTQLMTGMTYPNATFKDLDFDAGTGWDIVGWDSVGWGSPANLDLLTDTNLTSPTFTQTDDTVYDVVGGQFADGYGPEELVPGVVTDGMNFTVITKPGSTWNPNDVIDTLWNPNGSLNTRSPDLEGWDDTNWAAQPLYRTGFSVDRITVVPDSANTVSFADVVDNPAHLVVYVDYPEATFAQDQYRLILTQDYTVDWVNKTITFTQSHPTVDVVLYQFGGGNQLSRNNNTVLPLRDIDGHSEICLDISYSDITLPSAANNYRTACVLVNGQKLQYGVDYTLQPQALTPLTRIVFTNLYNNATDWVTWVITSGPEGYSIPETQDISSTDIAVGIPFPLSNWAGSTTTKVAIFEINGVRYGDEISTISYLKNINLAYGVLGAQYSGAEPFNPNRLTVYVNGVDITSGYGTQWTTNWTGTAISGLDAEYYVASPIGYLDTGTGLDTSGIYVMLNAAYAATVPTGAVITITYDLSAIGAYTIDQINNTLTVHVAIPPGSTVSVTTFNDTANQYLLTQSYLVADSTTDFVIDQDFIPDVERMWVSLAPFINSPGGYLKPTNMEIVGRNTLRLTPPIAPPPGQIYELTIESMVPSATPAQIEFRINTTKTGMSTVWNQNSQTKTYLTQTTVNTLRPDDVLHVENVSKLVDVIDTTTAMSGGILTYAGSQLLANQITSLTIYADTVPGYSTGTMLPAEYTVVNAHTIAITLGDASVSGTVRLRIACGNKLLIQDEQLQFTSVDLDTNTITGLLHGRNTTITNAVYEQYSTVQGALDKNQLPQQYYSQQWGAPLQASSYPAALFLRMSV